MKVLMGTLRKGAIVSITCWDFKSHLFRALVLPTFMFGTKIWGGNLKNSIGKSLRKA